MFSHICTPLTSVRRLWHRNSRFSRWAPRFSQKANKIVAIRSALFSLSPFLELYSQPHWSSQMKSTYPAQSVFPPTWRCCRWPQSKMIAWRSTRCTARKAFVSADISTMKEPNGMSIADNKLSVGLKFILSPIISQTITTTFSLFRPIYCFRENIIITIYILLES